jgi:hypothetical protein
MVGGYLRVLPASSTTKTGRHDIVEILLKVALNTIKIKKNQRFYGRHHDLVNLCRVSYASFFGITTRSFPHSWLIVGFVARVTRWISIVGQELLTLLEHMLWWGWCYSVFVFCAVSYFFWPLCCLSFLLLLITPLVSSNFSLNRGGDSIRLFVCWFDGV